MTVKMTQKIIYLYFHTIYILIYSIIFTYCNRVLVKFVIGKDACRIPPKDRLDPYSCSLWDVKELGQYNTSLAFKTIANNC